MNNISIDQLEEKIVAGAEIIDTYFDPNATRIGQKYEVIERRQIITPLTPPEKPGFLKKPGF